jgi:hypothetical protein
VQVHSFAKRDRSQLVDVVQANHRLRELQISDVLEPRPNFLRSHGEILLGAHFLKALKDERGQAVPLRRVEEKSPIDW